MAETAYVALGSNMGDAKSNIEAAVNALDTVPGITVDAVSPVYETKPWGYEDQNNFCNACARLKAEISPEALLGVCLGIEAGLGRIRKVTNGPRVIDIDVLIYKGQERNTRELILPHPRMNERDFVLVPLKDVAQEDMIASLEEKIRNLTEHYIV